MPRYHGLWGSQQYTCTSVTTVHRLRWASSILRFHVKDRRNAAGSVRTRWLSAVTTRAVSSPGTFTSIVTRDCRSTNVAMCVCCEPVIRSPS